MEHNPEKDEVSRQPKRGPGNTIMLLIILFSWLLFYAFIGSRGGG